MIIIIGDSWGVGEYDARHNLSGPGFAQYLSLHDRVVNLSFGGSSNSTSLDRLQDFLSRYNVDAHDTIYWIVTCPSRCRLGAQYFLDSDISLLETAQDLLYQALDRADALAQQYHTCLRLIGGLCDLDWLTLDRWPGLTICVPSWSQLLAPDHPTGIIDPEWWADLGAMLKTHAPHRMDEWLQISDRISQRRLSWSKIFPTEPCHPDRNGHRLLRDYLYPNWTHKT